MYHFPDYLDRVYVRLIMMNILCDLRFADLCHFVIRLLYDLCANLSFLCLHGLSRNEKKRQKKNGVDFKHGAHVVKS